MKNTEELKQELLEEIEFNYFQVDPDGFKKFKDKFEQYATIREKETSIGFGLWVNEHRLKGTENFDFAPSDTEGWYLEWYAKHKEQ